MYPIGQSKITDHMQFGTCSKSESKIHGLNLFAIFGGKTEVEN